MQGFSRNKDIILVKRNKEKGFAITEKPKKVCGMEKSQETLPSNSINKLAIQPLVWNISTKICNLAKHVAKLLSPLSQTYALLIAQNSS